MIDPLTIAAVFTGDGLRLRPQSLERLRAAFGAGETLALEVHAMRSMKSHRHYFASLRDLWLNLPEQLAEMPYAKSPETLRAQALIATGFADCQSVDCESKAAAERVAAFMGGGREYALVQTRGPVVIRWTARSQSVRAMGAAEFQRSKTEVLHWCDALVSGARDDIEKMIDRSNGL